MIGITAVNGGRRKSAPTTRTKTIFVGRRVCQGTMSQFTVNTDVVGLTTSNPYFGSQSTTSISHDNRHTHRKQSAHTLPFSHQFVPFLLVIRLPVTSLTT